MAYNNEIIRVLFSNTELFYVNWAVSLLLVFLTVVMITRDIEKWKSLAFPVALMYTIAGMPISLPIVFVLSLIFVQSAVSMQLIGNLVGSAMDSDLGSFIPKFKREKIPVIGRFFKSTKTTGKKISDFSNVQ